MFIHPCNSRNASEFFSCTHKSYVLLILLLNMKCKVPALFSYSRLTIKFLDLSYVLVPNDAHVILLPKNHTLLLLYPSHVILFFLYFSLSFCLLLSFKAATDPLSLWWASMASHRSNQTSVKSHTHRSS